MGAVAFQKGLGVTHSCAHALSTVCDMHHGLANGIMLPFAMEFNLPIVLEQFSRVAQALNLPEKKPESVVGWIHQLKEKIDIPEKLSAVGVKSGDIDLLVQVAVADSCHLSNPRVVSASDFRNIFEKAL
jgi:alcohol dehydrogenase class IV